MFLLIKKMITSKLAGSKFILNEEGVARDDAFVNLCVVAANNKHIY